MFARDDITALALAYLQEGLTVARAAGASLDDGVPQEILTGFHRAPPDLSTSILTDREAGYSARKKMIPFWIIFDTAAKPNKKNY